MPRPRNKEDLLFAAEENFKKLNTLIDSLSEKEMTTPFDFSADVKKTEAHWKRDKNVRDVLVHLYEWHRLMLRFIDGNADGKTMQFLPKPYNWRTIASMNQVFWEQNQETDMEEARKLLAKSHAEVLEKIQGFSNEELFLSKAFPAVGGSVIGSYFVSATSSHYDWAIKKIKAHKRKVPGKLAISIVKPLKNK